MPDIIEDGILYVSLRYSTAVHLCCCGCRNEVVTPLQHSGWALIYQADSVSLAPSIGSWGLPCQSHYWITENRVVSAPKWTRRQVLSSRAALRHEYREISDDVAGHEVHAADRNQSWPRWFARLFNRD
jgi:hypothetical protein